jgi:hypothetical protein
MVARSPFHYRFPLTLGLCVAGSALSFIVPALSLQPGAMLSYLPDHTKTGNADGPMQVQLRADILDSTMWLQRLLLESESQGHPITNFIARPLAPNKATFLERCITSSELANRAADRFADAGFEGYTRLHGARRGSIQHARVIGGKPRHLVQEQAHIRTVDVMKVYESPEGHYPPPLERVVRGKKAKLV